MLSFQPGGVVGRLCAPRELVCVRSWRQDTGETGRGRALREGLSAPPWAVRQAELGWAFCI